MMTLNFIGGEYEVTSDDRLWLLRAVQAEGPPQLGVARALINCFCYLRSKRRFDGSLTRHIRAYAQPVNPRWFADGDLYAISLVTKSDEDKRDCARAASSRELKHCRRTEFAPHVVGAVSVSLETDYASDITDYAAANVDATGKGYVARTGAFPGLNRFWTRCPGWQGYAVGVPRVG